MSIADRVVLDWRPRRDTRSLRWTIADRFGTDKPLRRRSWNRRVLLDQSPEAGYDGSGCTGFALAHVAGSTPRYRPVTRADAIRYYHGARTMDQWQGESYEGSSVLGACQYGRSVGLLGAYYWASTVEELAHAVAQFGPADVGTNWYHSMFTVADNGFINIDHGSRVAGGHSYALGAVDPFAETFTIWNSWAGWGVDQSAKIRWSTFARLLAEDGEAALPRKVRT